MKRQKKICVVGAGPSSAIAVFELLSHGHSVTVIDPTELGGGEDIFSKRLILKDRFDKDYVYTGGAPLSHVSDEEIFPIETRHIGGLSNIWGGVFFPGYRSHYMKSGLDDNYYSKVAKTLKDFLRIEASPINSWDLDEAKIGSGKPLYKFFPPQMALNHQGEIWSAKEAWSYLHSLNDLDLISGVVLSFREIADTVEVTIKTETEIKIEVFDRLILGAGPLGNAKIAINSIQDLKEINLEDSAVSYCLALSLNRAKPKKEMRPLRCGFEFQNGFPTRYFQIYDLSERLLKSLKFDFLRHLVKAINWTFGNSLRVIMIFKNGEDSKGLSIRKINEKIHIQSTRPKTKMLGRFIVPRFVYFLREEKIILLPLLKKASIGDGAHLAGSLNGLGRNVRAIGMSGSSKVFAGPVTFLAMALTVKIIEELEEDT